MKFQKGHKINLGRKRKPFTQTARLNMSNAHKGKKLTEITRKKLHDSLKGRVFSEEHKKKISKSKLGKPNFKLRGENHPLWKGGITSINMKIRTSIEYKIWRRSIFERDRYTCIWCGVKSGNGKAIIIHADHIKPFALFPELRFAIDNGRTLCIDCHKTTDSYAGRIKKINHPEVWSQSII